jgi:hypothetical protein
MLEASNKALVEDDRGWVDNNALSTNVLVVHVSAHNHIVASQPIYSHAMTFLLLSCHANRQQLCPVAYIITTSKPRAMTWKPLPFHPSQPSQHFPQGKHYIALP